MCRCTSQVRQTLQNRRSFVKEIPVNLPDTPPYQQGETAMELTLTEPGSYAHVRLTAGDERQ